MERFVELRHGFRKSAGADIGLSALTAVAEDGACAQLFRAIDTGSTLIRVSVSAVHRPSATKAGEVGR
jgi:hypothetical protein